MSKKVYMVGHECDDKGWKMGYHSFTRPEDAVQLMRDYVAKNIRYSRSQGLVVRNLHVWRDTVMNDASEKSQTISYMSDGHFHEFRVWAVNLHSERIPANDVIGY